MTLIYPTEVHLLFNLDPNVLIRPNLHSDQPQKEVKCYVTGCAPALVVSNIRSSALQQAVRIM